MSNTGITKQIQYAYDDIGRAVMAGAAMLRDHIIECYDFKV